MTYTIITDQAELQKGIARFHAVLKKELQSAGVHMIGFPSGNVDKDTFVSPDVDFWFSTWPVKRKGLPDYACNAFGVRAHLRNTISNTIVFQLNIPPQGLYRQLSGILVKGRGGTVYVGHRGRLGGGAKGVGKSAFKTWYADGDWKTVIDSDEEAEVLLLGRLDKPAALVGGLESFMHTAVEFKEFAAALREENANRSKQSPALAGSTKHAGAAGTGKLRFNPEATGEFEINAKRAYKANRTHGNVVLALRDWAKASGALETGNQDHADLVARMAKGLHLFEVKTRADSQSVFTGIGQLFGYGLRWKPVKKVLVLPNASAHRFREQLGQLGIEVMGYEYARAGITFHPAP